MKELDLHGKRHSEVEPLVENFIIKHQYEVPLRIITGKSNEMQRIVMNAVYTTRCEKVDLFFDGYIVIHKV